MFKEIEKQVQHIHFTSGNFKMVQLKRNPLQKDSLKSCSNCLIYGAQKLAEAGGVLGD